MSVRAIHRVSLKVVSARDLGANVREVVLADEERWLLPPFSAGAHVDLHLPGGAIRQYSLAGDPGEGSAWRIAVLREEAGRGGSRALHELREGAEVLAWLCCKQRLCI